MSNVNKMNIHESGGTLWTQFLRWKQADETAVAIYREEKPISRQVLFEISEVVAKQLMDAGVKSGSRVLLDAYPAVDTVVVGMAVSKLEGVICPINPKLGENERNVIIEQLRPVAVIRKSGLENSERLKGTDGLLIVRAPAFKPTGEKSVDTKDKAVFIGFTSGTTGIPKAVPHTANSLNYAVRSEFDIAGLQSGDPIISITPISSSAGWAFYVHMGLTLGLPLVIVEKWDPKRTLELIVLHKVAWSMCVPTHLHMLIELAKNGEWNKHLTSMKALAVGGSPNSEAMVMEAEKYLGVQVLRMYGMSECLGHASMRLSDPLERRRIYDGIPFPGTSLEAYDKNGKILPRETIGQAGVYGPSLFLGYLTGLGADQNFFTPDGAFLTGDLIIRDKDGYVQVVGRIKDQIIRGGLNIDPAEVETALEKHPDIVESALIGYPDKRLGERLCAVIVTRSKKIPSVESLSKFIQELGLAKFKSPERVVSVSVLPKTDAGKPDKKKIKQLAVKVLSD